MNDMTISKRMDADQSHITDQIFNLTLEIIYLLTGESYEVVKKKSSKTLSASPFLTPDRNNRQRILQITQKISDLLTGEVPIRCQDVSVYFSMEEWEYLEGHKDLYKDVMMEDHQTLTSPDGNSNANPSERCPRPLYSWDSTQEDHATPYQHEEQLYIKLEVKEEEEEKTSVMGYQQIGMMATVKPEEPSPDISTNGQLDNILQDSSEVNPVTQNTHQRTYCLETSMDPCNSKESSDKLCAVTSDIPLSFHSVNAATDPSNSKESSGESHTVTSGIYLISQTSRSSTDSCNPEEYSDQSHTVIPDLHLKFHSVEGSTDPSLPRESSGQLHTATSDIYPSSKGLKRSTVTSNSNESSLSHEGVCIGESIFSCLGCGKSFKMKSELHSHLRSHTSVTFSCLQCEKSFTEKSELLLHQKSHKGGTHYSCSKCGKPFPNKSHLLRHQRVHTDDRPYLCTECGKCFKEKASLLKHQRSHLGDRPHSCPKCGERRPKQKGFGNTDSHVYKNEPPTRL